MCREPRPLFDVVNVGSFGSAFASFSLRLPLNYCFCEVQIFLPTHVTKIGHLSLNNDSIQLPICVEFFKNRNISSSVFICNIEESSMDRIRGNRIIKIFFRFFSRPLYKLLNGPRLT